MKNTIVLNEKVYLDEYLKSNKFLDNPYYIVGLYIRYQYFYNNLKPKQIKQVAYDFLESRYPQFSYNKSYWDDFIDISIRKAKKYPLRELNGIRITQMELNTISNIKNKILERLAFTLLCLAKYSIAVNPKSNGWVNFDAKIIYSLAHINCTVAERYQKLSKLYDMGLLELPKKNDNLSVRVTYINDNSDAALFIDDFRELGFEYLKYKGENYIRCGECGKLIRNNKNGTRRYCLDCAAYSPQLYKTMTCTDCGKEFRVDAMNNQSCRCDVCQEKRDKALKKERNRRYYLKKTQN